jgi:hypothetical protein
VCEPNTEKDYPARGVTRMADVRVRSMCDELVVFDDGEGVRESLSHDVETPCAEKRP